MRKGMKLWEQRAETAEGNCFDRRWRRAFVVLLFARTVTEKRGRSTSIHNHYTTLSHSVQIVVSPSCFINSSSLAFAIVE